MGLGSTPRNTQRNVFVDIRSNASKGPEGVGFSQYIPASEGAEKKVVMHEHVEGNLINFSLKEQPIFEDRLVKVNPRTEIICSATFKDDKNGPNVVVSVPLMSGFGRKLAGLVNATKHTSPFVRLRASWADTGTQFGESKPLMKPTAYLTMNKDGPKGDRIDPLYVDNSGKELRLENGAPAMLPMGTPVLINKKEVWDFTACDEIAAATAATAAEYFAAQREGHHEAAAPAPADDGVDLNEAAEAAAPRG